MKKPYPRTAEEFIEAWTEMNVELREDNCLVTLVIPTVEQTQEWMDQTTHQH